MRNFILLLSLLFVISLSFWRRYGPHSVSYSTSPAVKQCDDDPDGISDPVCVQIGSQWPTLWGTTCPSWPVNVPQNWTMTCWYWDSQIPTISINYTTHTWTNNLSLNISLSDQGWSKLKLVKYRWKVDGTRQTWQVKNGNINSNSYSFSLSVPEGVVYLEVYVEDGATNSVDRVFWPYYIDKTSPDMSYFSVLLDGKRPNYAVLANSNGQLYIEYSQPCAHNACAPVRVYYQYELYTTASLSSENSIYWGNNWTSTNADDNGQFTITKSWNISKVTPSLDFDTSKGGRQYSLKVTKICDDAWNCISPNTEYSWWVYANTPVNYEVVNSSDLDNIKIWNNSDTFSLYLTLKDQYNNPLVPAPGINRQVKVNINYNNSVYLNQYKLQWAGIKYLYKLGSWQTSTIGGNKSFWYSYVTYNSNLANGKYYFQFKSYVPTYDWYNKAYGHFKISSINYSITDSLWDNRSNSLSINKYLKFKPQVYTKINWIPPLAAEWTYKDFKIQIFTNWTQKYNASTFMVQFDPKGNPIDTYLAFNDTCDWWKYAIYWSNNENLISYLYWSAQNKIGTYSSWNKITNSTFYEKFVLKPWGILDPTNQWVLSTHIAVKYSDGTVAVWNSDLVGATNYNFNSSEENYLIQTSLWVKGLVGISENFKNKIHTILSGNVRMIGWVINKAELRSKIYRLVYKKFRSINIKKLYDNLIFYPEDLFAGSNITYKTENYRWVSIYFFSWYSKRLVIPGWKDNSSRILLITKWIDIFISWDIQNVNNGIFGIICLKDENGNGGNIYINNNITNIEAYIYTDKAIITYKWNPLGNYQTQESLSQNDLKNQLLIKWVLWSFNTLWASVNWKCPYFDKWCSNPKKYDLEYLRRFYLVNNSVLDNSWDANSYIPYGSPDTKLIWWIQCHLKSISNVKYTYCKDKDTKLKNLLSIGTSEKWPLFKQPLSEELLFKLSPVIVLYDNKFKSIYLPIFSDLVNWEY